VPAAHPAGRNLRFTDRAIDGLLSPCPGMLLSMMTTLEKRSNHQAGGEGLSMRQVKPAADKRAADRKRTKKKPGEPGFFPREPEGQQPSCSLLLRDRPAIPSGL